MRSRWGIRRRWGWIVLTRCRIIRWELDSERGDMHEFVCVDLVVVLVVALGGGLDVWEVFTRCRLDLSCYSLAFPCFVLPRLVSFTTCSFPLLSFVVLVVFGWLGWRCWVWVDREGWWLWLHSRCDDVTIERRCTWSRKEVGGVVFVVLDDVVVICELLQLFHSRLQLLTRFPFVRSFTA
jgi:hypothetical protein